MNKILEYKNITGEIKDVDSKNKIVTGYLSAFGNVDSYGDIIEPGAFKKSIQERGEQIYFLNQHDWKQPHGFFKMLIEDEKGLYFESNPLIDTTYSQDLIKLYEAGIIKEHSIGYTTEKSSFDQDKNIRYLKELKLYEGSNVTRGANSQTPFEGFKSKTLPEINDEVKKITKAVKNGTFTDETFILLELALKQLQLDAIEIGKKSLEDLKPFNNTLETNKPNEAKTIQEFLKTI